MDYNPRESLDKMAVSNRSKHQWDSGRSGYPAPARRASSESRLEVLHNQEFMNKLVAKPSIEEEPAKEEMERSYRHEPVLSEDSIVDMPSDEEALNLEFEACIQEHQDTKLKIFPRLLKCLKSSHFYVQLVTYITSVLLVGIPTTILCGCLGGLAVFARVWIWVPVLKLYLFWLHSCAPLLLRPAQLLCVPCVDICARRYRQIRIDTRLSGLSEMPVSVKKV